MAFNEATRFFIDGPFALMIRNPRNPIGIVKGERVHDVAADLEIPGATYRVFSDGSCEASSVEASAGSRCARCSERRAIALSSICGGSTALRVVIRRCIH
jgi:hypothetical protein